MDKCLEVYRKMHNQYQELMRDETARSHSGHWSRALVGKMQAIKSNYENVNSHVSSSALGNAYY